jgi:SAM-dependent methyltransferase
MVDNRYDGIWCSGTLIHFPKPLVKNLIFDLNRLLTENGVLMVNCAIDNPRLIANDRRFFAYWGNREDFECLLVAAGLKIDTVVTNFVSLNTYNESGLEIQWDNFLCVLRKEEENIKKAELTITAYDLIVRRFIDEHASNVDNVIVDKISHLIKEKRLGGRILDAGCGPGHYTNAFALRGFEAIGIDLSALMVETASRNYPGCRFEIADFCDLPFPENYFSSVFCMAAFQHIPIEEFHALRTLEGFYRVLEEDGILMLNVQLYRETGFEPDGRFTQGYKDEGEAMDLLEKAGFDIIESREWKLKPGRNSFQRDIELNFCDFIACKRSGVE